MLHVAEFALPAVYLIFSLTLKLLRPCACVFLYPGFAFWYNNNNNNNKLAVVVFLLTSAIFEQAKVFAAKPDGPSLIQDPHVRGRE